MARPVTFTAKPRPAPKPRPSPKPDTSFNFGYNATPKKKGGKAGGGS